MQKIEYRSTEDVYMRILEGRRQLGVWRSAIGSRLKSKVNCITDLEIMGSFNSISSAFLSKLSGVSICNNVLEDGSQTIGNVAGKGPHSSGKDPFSGGCEECQQVVASKLSERESTRNLFNKWLRGRDGGGMKSHGTTTKSSGIRLEN